MVWMISNPKRTMFSNNFLRSISDPKLLVRHYLVAWFLEFLCRKKKRRKQRNFNDVQNYWRASRSLLKILHFPENFQSFFFFNFSFLLHSNDRSSDKFRSFNQHKSRICVSFDETNWEKSVICVTFKLHLPVRKLTTISIRNIVSLKQLNAIHLVLKSSLKNDIATGSIIRLATKSNNIQRSQ